MSTGQQASLLLSFRRTLVLSLALALGVAGQRAHGGSLTSVAPAGASADVAINITSTSFDSNAANHQVTFTPLSGPAATVVPSRVTVLDAATGLRRLTVTVPSGLSLGVAALQVRNTVTGEVSNGQSIDIIAIALPEATTGLRGATNLRVRITGSPLTRFVAGSTRAAFGAGITVISTTVETPTSLTATISILANAALGDRTVSVISNQQTALLAAGFRVIEVAPPTNVAPTVNAGADQTITLPAGAQLNGTVTDDGLPSGAAVTRTWSKTSGQGTVTFGDDHSASTTATFSQAGTYVLRLSASDTALSAFDELTVTVNPAAPTNQAPAVDAGPNQTITLPANAQLSGTVTDDGLPSGAAVTRTWSKTSGQGTVTFGNEHSASTTATFSEAGSYVLRLTASDTVFTVFDELAITVNPATPGNQAPVARPTGPAAGTTGQILSFDGSTSSDPDNDPLTYSWSFGDSVAADGAVAAHTYTLADRFTVTLTVRDGKGGVHSASIPVTISQSNRPPVARPGGPYTGDAGSTMAVTGKASTDPDGDALSYAWDFGDGSSGTGQNPTHAYLTQGTFTVTLTVEDGRQGVHAATTSAVIGPAVDRAPPAVALTAPTQALPGAQVLVTAAATDNVAVSSVTFEVEGGSPMQVTSPPYRQVVPIAPFAAPGSTVKVKATARDAANNAGSDQATITIVAAPDLTKPTVSIAVPPQASPGSTVLISATAVDNAGVSGVAFSTAGLAIGTSLTQPYGVSYVVPANTQPNTTLTFTARATDFSGNSADASGTLAIVAAPDTQPPTVSLTAPPEVNEGGVVHLTATAADNVKVSSVAFLIDGVVVATRLTAPYAADFTVPASYRAGTVLRARARALDSSGLDAFSDGDTRVVGAAGPGAGVIAGEVYDDSTGLPLAGVQVALAGTDAGGQPYNLTATTDEFGKYFVPASGGHGVLQIGKPGWTRVDRVVTIPTQSTLEPLDARLTPLGSPTNISAIVGGTLTAGDVSLTLAAGALAGDAPLSIASIGGQGLEGLLPAGWSPIAGLDVWPHATTFNGSQPISVPNRLKLPVGTALVFATWDEAASAWRAMGDAPIAGDPSKLTALVDRAGQYAWLLADAAPAVPSHPAAGVLLAGVSLAEVPGGATIDITPQPRIIFYKPGVNSNVGAVLRPGLLLPSGTPIRSKITESYRFTSGDQAHPAPFVEDLVFYQVPGPASTVSASFIVTPSLTFDPLAFQQGVITVELRVPSGGGSRPTVGPDGGTASSASGEQIEIPANGFDTSTPVEIEPLTSDSLGVALPPGLSFVGAVSLGFSGATLRLPGAISVPRPDVIDDSAPIVLLRLVYVQGATRFLLVGAGRVVGTRILSSPTIPGVPVSLAGVTSAGRYVFARSTGSLGFTAGSVFGPAGGGFAGAVVTTGTPSLVSLSNATGGYAALAAVGPVTVTAIDPQRLDAGTTQGNLGAAGGVIAADVRLVAQAPRVLSLAPAEGATSVPLSTPIVATFSEPIDPASLAAGPGITLTGPAGAAVSGAIVLSSGNTVATFRPSVVLVPNAAYTITVATTLRDLAGQPLEGPVVAHFTSLDTTPPAAPPAGSITATIPDGNGMTTVTGTQGSAAPHDTVQIVNITKKTFFPALVQADGSFSATFAVSLADRLQVAITDPSGNQTVVPLPRFSRTNPDGSRAAVVGTEGGRVSGPNGTAVDIPEGAFPDGTVVTIQSIPEASFPIQLTAEQRAFFSYAGGIELDFGGAVPTSSVTLSVAAQGQESVEDRWIVGQVLSVAGEQVLNVAGIARVIDGRITMYASPCPGVQTAAKYSFVRPIQEGVGLSFGAFAADEEGSVVRMTLAQIGPGGQDASVSLPHSVVATDESGFVCFPSITSRITVQPNQDRVVIAASQFKAGDRELIIFNRATEETFYSPTSVVEYRFTVDGGIEDGFQVSAVGAAAQETPVAFQLSPAETGRVDVRVDVTQFHSAVTELRIRNTRTGAVQTVLQSTAAVKIAVTPSFVGYDVTIVGAAEQSRFLSDGLFTVEPSAVPTGNLVARAAPGALDQATDLFLERRSAQNTATVVERLAIPAAARQADGSLAYGFNGSVVTDAFRVEVAYRDGRPSEFIWVPTLAITLPAAAAPPVPEPLDLQSGPSAEARSAVDQTPPATSVVRVPIPPKDVVYNVGPTGGATPPKLVSKPAFLSRFDPTGVLTFTFSKGIKRESALQPEGILLVDSEGILVKGEVRLTNKNKTLTFVPNAPLKLDTTYYLAFTGLTDGAGHRVSARAIQFRTMAPVYSAPSFTGSLKLLDSLVTIKKSSASGSQTLGFALSGDLSDDRSMVILDLTNPTLPVTLSTTLVGSGGHVTVVPNAHLDLRAESECGGGRVFNGDLAVVGAYDENRGSAVRFYDVRDPAKPCLIGAKLISFYLPATGTVTTNAGRSKAVTTLVSNGRLLSYSAVENVGLVLVDVGAHSPPFPADQRPQSQRREGNYTDVLVVRDLVVALKRATASVDVYKPDLSLVGSEALGMEEAVGMTYAPGVPFDFDRNGTHEDREIRDLVFAGGTGGVAIVDVTYASPLKVGFIPMADTVIYQVAFDREKRRLFASGMVRKPTNHWVMFTIALPPNGYGGGDFDGDGADDRISWQTAPAFYEQGAYSNYRALHFDSESRRLYVGAVHGFDVYGFDPPNLTGETTYTLFNASTSGLDYAHPISDRIRNAIVELRNDVGTPVQTTTTGPDGEYAFVVPEGHKVRVVVKAALGAPGREHTQVVNNTHPNWRVAPSSTVYEVSTELFSMPKTLVKNVHAETKWDAGSRTYPKRDGAPFAILESANKAHDYINMIVPGLQMPLLTYGWSEGNQPAKAPGPPNPDPKVAYNQGFLGSGAHYLSSLKTVFLSGAVNNNTDEYDTQVILHEWGHYFQGMFSRDDTTGGSHATDNILDPRMSFSEGFATAFAAMLSGDHIYVDTLGPGQAAAGWMDLEANRHRGFYSEDGIAEFLWDLHDHNETQAETSDWGSFDDAVELKLRPFLDALMGGVKTTPAFTTIYAFLHHLAPASPERARFSEVARLRKIEYSANAFEPVFTPPETVDGVRVGRLYTNVPTDGTEVESSGEGTAFAGTPLQSRTTHDPNNDNNKFHESVWFKFEVATAGSYTVTVTPVQTSLNKFRIDISGRGQERKFFHRTEKGKFQIAAMPMTNLQPGVYVLAVSTRDDADDVVQERFKISIKRD